MTTEPEAADERDTPPPWAVIVTLAAPLPAGTRLWVRREKWGTLGVDSSQGYRTWTPGVLTGLTIEEAP